MDFIFLCIDSACSYWTQGENLIVSEKLPRLNTLNKYGKCLWKKKKKYFCVFKILLKASRFSSRAFDFVVLVDWVCTGFSLQFVRYIDLVCNFLDMVEMLWYFMKWQKPIEWHVLLEIIYFLKYMYQILHSLIRGSLATHCIYTLTGKLIVMDLVLFKKRKEILRKPALYFKAS